MAERQLCEHVLHDLEPHTGRVFAELSEQITSTLFSFGEAVARTKKTPEKLSVLLDMYETMRDTMPQVRRVPHDPLQCHPRQAAGKLARNSRLS